MDKKTQKKLRTWLDNDLITEDVFYSIESFESSETQKTEKGTLSKTIIFKKRCKICGKNILVRPKMDPRSAQDGPKFALRQT